MKFDLLVIGGGPAGRNGAVAAAQLGKRVALIERQALAGGDDCLRSGGVSSKTLSEAVLQLSSGGRRDANGNVDFENRPAVVPDLRRKLVRVAEAERNAVDEQLQRYGVERFLGAARFVDPHHVEVQQPEGGITLSGDYTLIAAGTKPVRPEHIPFDGQCIVDADELLQMRNVPRSLVVVGGGATGVEFAVLFATLGVRVTVVDGRERLLELFDADVVDALLRHARALRVTLQLGDEVVDVQRADNRQTAIVQLENGRKLLGDCALISVGRVGRTDDLNLPAAGIEPDDRGRLWCNDDHQTWTPHIYGAGDVVGFPALASVSLEPGRRAVYHAFGRPFAAGKPFPCRLSTISALATALRQTAGLPVPAGSGPAGRLSARSSI